MALSPLHRRLFGRHATRYAREVPEQRRRTAEQEFRALWRDVAEGVGLARVVHVAAGVTVSVPRVGGVRLDRSGAVCRVTVQRHPGQSVGDWQTRATALADALGCARVRIDPMADHWLALTLLAADPLARSRVWSQRLPDGFIACTEDGRLLSQPWQRRPHCVVAGMTGSGKTQFAYGQLAPLAARRDVLVTGCDPSGLLWHPWDGLPGAGWRASGLRGDLADSRRVLAELCDEMDARLERLPRGVDVLVTDEATPLVVVVLEELPGLYRAAELVDRKVLAEVKGRVARLFSEGRKVGYRCVLLAQRLDAAVLDGAVRAQAAMRLSFASDRDGLAMAHPAGSVDPDEHALAAPGVAVLTAPTLGTVRVRSVRLSYADYDAAVTAAARPAA